MKKNKNIIIAIVGIFLVIGCFAACNRSGPDENVVTVTDEAGNVFEEVTEVVSNVVSEVVTEVVSEVVSEVQTKVVGGGKDYTGTTVIESEVVSRVVTEIHSELHSEVVTEIVTHTVPYTATTREKRTTRPRRTTTSKADESTATLAPVTDANGSTVATTAPVTGSGSGGSGGGGGGIGSGTVSVTPFENGVKLQVELDANGNPVNSYLKKAFGDIANSKQIYIDATVSGQEVNSAIGSGTNMKIWVKDEKFATQFTVGALKVRMITNPSGAFLTLSTGYYVSLADGADLTGFESDDIWGSIVSDADKKYVATTKVVSGNVTYACEEYMLDGTSVKYFFDMNGGALKRIESSVDGSVSILVVNGYSTSVSDSEFVVPSSYKEMSQEQIDSLLSSFSGK